MKNFFIEHRRSFKIGGIAVVAVLLLISIFGLAVDKEYGKQASVKVATGEVPTQRVEENKIFLGMENVTTFNPAVSNDEEAFYLSRLIYDSLFEVSGHMTPQPQLVKRYEYTDDALKITLKNDAKWHDGKGRVKAQDVAFSVDVIKAAGKKGPFAYKARAISNVEVIDDDHLKIYFSDSENRGLDLLTFPIFPQHQYETPGSFIGMQNGFYPIGSGLYECVSFDQKRLISLKPFKDYHGRQAMSRIKIKILDDKEKINKLVEASNISLNKDADYTRESKVTKEDVKFRDYPNGRIFFLGFNSNEKHFESAEVKKAVAMAIDNSEIVSDCFYNSARLSDSMFIPQFLDSEKRKDPYRKDTEKAEASLEIAGYRDTNGDGIAENADYQMLRLTLLVDASQDLNVEIAEVIQKNLKTVGIDVSLIQANEKNYENQLKKGNFSLYLGSLNVDEGYDLRNILASNGEYNFIGYENEELDEVYDHMRSGLQPQEMQRDFDNIKKIVDEDLPYYCIAHETCGIMLSPAIKGNIYPNFSNIYRGARTWYSVYDRMIESEQEGE